MSDRVCLDTSEAVCISNFDFFYVDQESTKLANIDGIFGLAPYDSTTIDTSYMGQLIQNNMVSEPVASFLYLNNGA